MENLVSRPDSRAILILGMHRSGTSAMARVCQLLGVYLGDDLAPAEDDNPKGFFEDTRISQAHESFLYELGVSWDYAGEFPLGWSKNEAAQIYQERLKTVVDDLAQQPLWGFKDPRTSRLLPLWQQLFDSLSCQPYCIIMVRNPLEVAASLAHRNNFSTQISVWLWLAYMLDVERYTRHFPRCFVHYDALLRDPRRCLQRIEDTFDMPWPVALEQAMAPVKMFLEPKLRHHQYSFNQLRSSAVPQPVQQLYSLLSGASDIADREKAFDAIHAEWQTFVRQFSTDSRLQQHIETLQKQNIELNEHAHTKQQELLKLSDWANDLKKSISLLQQESQQTKELLSEKHKTLMEISDWAEHQKEQLAIAQVTLDGKQAELDAKYAELMTMSDWAQSMNLRLQKFERSIVMKPAQKAMWLEYWGRDRVNQLLAYPIFQRWLHRRRYQHAMAQYPQLEQSVIAQKNCLIVVFPIITWDFRWQRPQQIVSRLAQQRGSVLYLAMSLFGSGKTYQNENEAGAELVFENLGEHVHQVWLHPQNTLNIYTDVLQGDDLANMALGLCAAIKNTKATELIYLIQFPGWASLAFELRDQLSGKVIFDCMDDHAGFSTNSEQAIETENTLLREADLVIASSALLEEKAQAFNNEVLLVNNGTESHHFSQPHTNGKLDNFQDKPIIGYYGAISDWFDTDIISYCANAKPDWNFVLIGDTFGCNTKAWENLPNIKLLGEIPYAELPGYLAYFDVCTIPFKIIPLTLATNPVKFYEYLSAGKPVVSVDLPELKPYKDDCYLADSAEQFLQQLEIALAEKDRPDLIERRIKLAKENSWDQRVEGILRHPILAQSNE